MRSSREHRDPLPPVDAPARQAAGGAAWARLAGGAALAAAAVAAARAARARPLLALAHALGV
jgi:hypothetical protein